MNQPVSNTMMYVVPESTAGLVEAPLDLNLQVAYQQAYLKGDQLRLTAFVLRSQFDHGTSLFVVQRMAEDGALHESSHTFTFREDFPETMRRYTAAERSSGTWVVFDWELMEEHVDCGSRWEAEQEALLLNAEGVYLV